MKNIYFLTMLFSFVVYFLIEIHSNSLTHSISKSVLPNTHLNDEIQCVHTILSTPQMICSKLKILSYSKLFLFPLGRIHKYSAYYTNLCMALQLRAVQFSNQAVMHPVLSLCYSIISLHYAICVQATDKIQSPPVFALHAQAYQASGFSGEQHFPIASFQETEVMLVTRDNLQVTHSMCSFYLHGTYG